MQYIVLTTGSCGNCYVFNEDGETLVVDDGVTYTKLSRELEGHDIPISSIKAMFLTHLHPDHSKGVGVFMRKTGLPVYVSRESFNGCKNEMEKQKIDRDKLSTFNHGETLSIGGYNITPFPTCHDSIGSSGYFIEHGESRIFLMTDTGIIPDEAFSFARDSRLKFIEANYDSAMLENGAYPKWLKERISGKYGHLSNDEAVDFANRTSRQGDQVYFIHVSENNNNINIIQSIVNKQIPSGIFVKVLKRGEMAGGFIDE